MSEIDTPVSGIESDTPLSMAEAIKAYSPEPADEAPSEEDTVETGEEADEDAETVDDDQTDDQVDEDGADTEAETDDDSDDNEPDDYDRGRYASDNAKVRLEDGTTVTIADLKRGSLREADYTRKTMSLAEERKAFEAEAGGVRQLREQLAEQARVVNEFAQQLMPQEPTFDPNDPVRYMEEKAAYDASMKRLQQIGHMTAQERQRQQQEQQQTAMRQRQEEATRLLEAMPELRDTAKYQEFMGTASNLMASTYGLSDAEFANMANDHRFYLIARDLAAYKRIKDAKPKAQQKIEGKPPVMKPGKRLSRDQQREASRKTAMDRLNKSGSVKDGIAALMAIQQG